VEAYLGFSPNIVLRYISTIRPTGSPTPVPLDVHAIPGSAHGDTVTISSFRPRAVERATRKSQQALPIGGLWLRASISTIFGEIVSFTGFAMLIRTWWAALAATLLLLSFVLVQGSGTRTTLRQAVRRKSFSNISARRRNSFLLFTSAVSHRVPY
jgi:hypothetical protein